MKRQEGRKEIQIQKFDYANSKNVEHVMFFNDMGATKRVTKGAEKAPGNNRRQQLSLQKKTIPETSHKIRNVLPTET